MFKRILLVAFLVGSISLGAGAADPSPTPGISKTKPEKGPFVKTDRGYMVPYQVQIPGTEAVFEMTPIPGGAVAVGSPEDEPGREDVEGPQFFVEIEPFWMATREVTWSEYKEYMNLYAIFKKFQSDQLRLVTDENMADAITAPTELYEPTFTFEKGEDPRQPAVTMTQYAAKQYSKWISAVTGEFYRLPSEAQWEHACRAGSKTAFSYGDDPSKLGEYAWYAENSDETTHPVGAKKPNAWGLYDMHGNVAEWVLDELLQDGYVKFGGKTVREVDAIVWPTKAYPRVVKGGSWQDPAEKCRCAARLGSHDEEWKSEDPNLPLSPWWFTSDPARGVGFRLVRPLSPPPEDKRERFWRADDEMIKLDVDSRILEGRGALGIVDPSLPEAIEKLED